jgi:8-oxo-dGTP pyrophosphatase MutT (NUDIX family)
VLLQPADRGFAVCLVRRHDEVAFMGGAHVFPGGSIDPADRLPDLDACVGTSAAAGRLPDLPAADALGHCVGALRELFEEAGILIARPARAGSLDLIDVSRVAAHRAALAAGDTTLAEIAERERVRLDLSALLPFGHWVTPESEVKRYDVRFFMALAPVGQPLAHDPGETTEAVWLRPTQAIDGCRLGDILLAPPTWTTLRWLERFQTADEALAWARAGHSWVVQPRLFELEGSRMLALPGDPLYPRVDGFEAAETRFRFGDGRWRALEA